MDNKKTEIWKELKEKGITAEVLVDKMREIKEREEEEKIKKEIEQEKRK